MNKFYIAAGAILASSLVVSLPEKAQALSELGPNGVKMPVVSSLPVYYSGDKFVLSKNGAGTQYLDMDYRALVIRDMVTGTTLKTLLSDVGSVVVNDSEDVFIMTKANKLYYATQFEEAKLLNSNISIEKLHGFIQGTDIVIGNYDNMLRGYNITSNQLVFEVQLGKSKKNLFAVKKDIAVSNGKTITIYDETGNYKDILQFDSAVSSLLYSPDGQSLLVGTEEHDIQSFNVANNYANNNITLFKNTLNTKSLVFDPSGKYLTVMKEEKANNPHRLREFRLFSIKDNERIYTELDNKRTSWERSDALLSNEGKFIHIGNNTYNAKNITKSPKSISLPTQYITMEAGSELKPAVTAKLLDGTTTTVTDGVTWKSDDLSVAYYDEDKKVFKPTSEGTFTLRASYLGFTTDVEVTVTKSAMSEIKEYLAKHTESGYYISNLGVKGIYLDQRIYKGSSYKGKNVVTTFTGKKNGKPVTYLDVARKANSSINFKKIEIQANGKTFKKNTKPYYYKGYESADIIKLSTADCKWIKENIDVNKSVTVKLKGGKKTVTIKLSKTQKDALLKGVLVNDYLK